MPAKRNFSSIFVCEEEPKKVGFPHLPRTRGTCSLGLLQNLKRQISGWIEWSVRKRGRDHVIRFWGFLSMLISEIGDLRKRREKINFLRGDSFSLSAIFHFRCFHLQPPFPKTPKSHFRQNKPSSNHNIYASFIYHKMILWPPLIFSPPKYAASSQPKHDLHTSHNDSFVFLFSTFDEVLRRDSYGHHTHNLKPPQPFFCFPTAYPNPLPPLQNTINDATHHQFQNHQRPRATILSCSQQLWFGLSNCTNRNMLLELGSWCCCLYWFSEQVANDFDFVWGFEFWALGW